MSDEEGLYDNFNVVPTEVQPYMYEPLASSSCNSVAENTKELDEEENEEEKSVTAPSSGPSSEWLAVFCYWMWIKAKC